MDNTGIGNITNINYRSDYNYYKCFLIEAAALEDTAKWTQELLLTWDSNIFAVHLTFLGIQLKPDSNSESEQVGIGVDEQMAHDFDNLWLANHQTEETIPIV